MASNWFSNMMSGRGRATTGRAVSSQPEPPTMAAEIPSYDELMSRARSKTLNPYDENMWNLAAQTLAEDARYAQPIMQMFDPNYALQNEMSQYEAAMVPLEYEAKRKQYQDMFNPNAKTDSWIQQQVAAGRSTEDILDDIENNPEILALQGVDIDLVKQQMSDIQSRYPDKPWYEKEMGKRQAIQSKYGMPGYIGYGAVQALGGLPGMLFADTLFPT